MAHHTVVRAAEHQTSIKGSRFLARVVPIDDAGGAVRHLDRARREHPDASHHCSAWRFGARYAADDDGEPGGTAGRPMLDVILKRDLDRLAIVCIRWFGGTKLGAGGLARAYGGSAAKALDAAGSRFVPDTVRATVHVPYPHLDLAHRTLDGWPGLVKGEARFAAGGAEVAIELRVADVDPLARRLADASAGGVTLDRADEMNDR